MEPGGICEGPPTGAGNCTISIEDAGWVDLDSVIGIEDGGDPTHKAWCDQGNREYNFDMEGPHKNRGIGTTWWDGIWNFEKNAARMQHMDDAFKKKYPDMPRDT